MWDNLETDPGELSSLALAYIGDAVYELYVRQYLIKKGYAKVGKLHKEAADLVNAGKQAQFLHELEPFLQEDERDVVRRGRNAKAGHLPKNAGLQEYKLSTGFEALLGYLYLARREERINELLMFVFKAPGKGKKSR